MQKKREGNVVSVRLDSATKQRLSVESLATGRTLSETVRIVCARHINRETPVESLVDELATIKVALNTLATDLELVTRLLWVGLKLGTDDDAKEWVRANLRGGR